MIDGRAFLQECSRPFGRAHNCASAVRAALAASPGFRAAWQHWQAMPAARKAAAIAGQGTAAAAAEAAAAAALPPAGETGYAWGVVRVAGSELMAVRMAGAWYCRASNGAARLENPDIIAAWSA